MENLVDTNHHNVSNDLNLKFHHVGLLVNDINSAIDEYQALFGKSNVSNVFTIHSQEVKVCFVKISPENYIELVQPITENSVVCKLLKKRITYYHIAYLVKDIEHTVKILEARNYKSAEYFFSEAFNNKKCIFLFSPQAHLIELIEQ